MARRIVCRCRSRPSSPIHAMFAAYSRSWLRSKLPPPSARHVRPHDPEPSAPHGSGPQERSYLSSCLSWLHLLKSWSLRQSRGGSVRGGESISFDGKRLELRPDLGIYLTGRHRNFPLVVECKIIDGPTGKGVDLYCVNGIRRFVEG